MPADPADPSVPSPRLSRPPRLTRRGLVLGGSAVAALGLAGWAPLPAAAADPYDRVRARWRAMFSGGDLDPADEDYRAAVARLDADVATARAKLDRSGDRTQVFTDYPLDGVSWGITESYNRLRTMATAYVVAGSDGHGDQARLTEVLEGLRTVHEVVYHRGQHEFDNWWHWEIGGPIALGDTCALVYDHLAADDLAGYLDAVDFYVPDPTTITASTGHPILSTGANRVWLCQVVAGRGVLGRSAERIGAARDALSDVFAYVTEGDGFYADGSFIQHETVPYTGSYGVALLGGIATLMAMLAGSPWPIDDPASRIVLDSVERTFRPVMYDGLMMDFVRGRCVSRAGETDHSIGNQSIEAILRLAQSTEPSEARRWQAICRGWMGRDGYDDIFADASLGRLGLLIPVREDGTLEPVAEPAGHRVLGQMDRVVHRRPGWAYSLAMCSDRICHYEYGNGENETGFRTGSGMRYLYDGDGGQFTDGFWPTVDLDRLPGTTVDSTPLAPRSGGGDFGKTLAPTSFAGGVALGPYGMAGMALRCIDSPTRARKSWFCLDDRVVELGAGIDGGQGHPVETIVENRNLHASGAVALVVDGDTQPDEQGWSAVLAGARWAHLDGVAGYAFLEPTDLHALREERTGSWHDINVAGPTAPVTRRYLTLWLDHGSDPSGETYAYLVAPGATADATAAMAANPGVRVLANTGDVQAVRTVRARPSQLVGADFFAPGRVRAPGVPFAVDAPCSVLVRGDGNELAVAVADPTQNSDRVTVRIEAAGYHGWDGDPTVTVDLGRRVVATVDTSARDGRSHTWTLSR